MQTLNALSVSLPLSLSLSISIFSVSACFIGMKVEEKMLPKHQYFVIYTQTLHCITIYSLLCLLGLGHHFSDIFDTV